MDTNISIKTTLDTYLLNKPPKIIDRISPSQLGKCHRAHYLKIMKYEPLVKPTSAALANFEVGFLWEKLIKDALDAQDIQYEFQTSFLVPELNMSGSTDFIIGDKMEKAVIWDSKTMASKWFWYREGKRKRGQYDWWEENYSYIIQQGAYLLMAEKLGYKIDKAVLGFISKDDGFVGEELEVRLTDKLRRELMERINELNDYLAAGELPPCTCEGWLVGYCDFGNPNTREPNRTKKMVNTECCGTVEEMDKWRLDFDAKQAKKPAKV